ncbi:MAG: ACP S-malonyltransferase [Holophagaceae bacterium]|nr:ACP S-malonyltransferase [Holophagaceae bacterium]
MAKTAWLFPGQGSQAVGMGMAFAKASPLAEKILEEADEALGFALSKIMADGPEETLKLTENTQPAILTHSVMTLEVCRDRLPKPDFVAGHSLGEYSALVAAGSLSFTDAVRTVRKRGKSMQEAVPVGIGAMAAVIGMSATDVEAGCSEVSSATGKIVVPANYNGAGQVVIAGHADAVDAAIEALKGMGGRKMIKLPVSAPFHSPLMEPARLAMEPVLKALEFKAPICPLINNVDARSATDPEALRSGLIRQISGAVRWEDTMKYLLGLGVATFIELGPGKVLGSIATRMAKDGGVDIRAISIGAPEDFASCGF